MKTGNISKYARPGHPAEKIRSLIPWHTPCNKGMSGIFCKAFCQDIKAMARGPKDCTEMLISPGQPLLSDRMPRRCLRHWVQLKRCSTLRSPAVFDIVRSVLRELARTNLHDCASSVRVFVYGDDDDKQLMPTFLAEKFFSARTK